MLSTSLFRKPLVIFCSRLSVCPTGLRVIRLPSRSRSYFCVASVASVCRAPSESSMSVTTYSQGSASMLTLKLIRIFSSASVSRRSCVRMVGCRKTLVSYRRSDTSARNAKKERMDPWKDASWRMSAGNFGYRSMTRSERSDRIIADTRARPPSRRRSPGHTTA